MSYDSLLIHLCTVKRFGSVSNDGYGNPIKVWVDDSINNPCRLTTSSGREIKVGAEVVVADYKLFVEDTLSITEQDRVEISSILYEILLVQNYSDSGILHHKQAYLIAYNHLGSSFNIYKSNGFKEWKGKK